MMALRPLDNDDLSPSSAPLAVRVVGTVAVVIVGLLLLRWVFGIVWLLIRLGIVVALVAGAFYLYREFARKDA